MAATFRVRRHSFQPPFGSKCPSSTATAVSPTTTHLPQKPVCSGLSISYTIVSLFTNASLMSCSGVRKSRLEKNLRRWRCTISGSNEPALSGVNIW